MIIKYDVIRYDNKVIIRWKKKILTQIENWTFFFTYLFIFMFDVWHNNTEDLKKNKAQYQFATKTIHTAVKNYSTPLTRDIQCTLKGF